MAVKSDVGGVRKKPYCKIPLQVSVELRKLHQNVGMPGSVLVKQFMKYSPASIYKHMVKPMPDQTDDKRRNNPGRPRLNVSSQMVSKDCPKQTRRKYYNKLPLDISIFLRYLHQHQGISGRELVRRYPKFSPASVYRHMCKSIGDTLKDKRKFNPGRPAALSARDKRRILQEVPKLRKTIEGSFTVDDLRKSSGIGKDISNMTIRRVLHKEGYAYRGKRRKGILTEKDTQMRLKFAKHAKKSLDCDIWCKEISFYLDGAGFTHKVNPCQSEKRKGGKTWRKKGEGLSLYCTAAGSSEGCGGRVAKFMVAIAYGKGVTMCEEFKVSLNGKSFADFVRAHFPPCFSASVNPEGKIFLQDGDPSQNSAVALEALAEIGGRKFSIPPRSPDLNTIKNLFHYAKRQLKVDAIEKKITHERYNEFFDRVKDTMKSTQVTILDNIISSMPKRIDLVIKSRGQRIKY